MKYFSRHIIMPVHLNSTKSLCCGQLLSWVNEEATIFASCQMRSQFHIAKVISEISFMAPAQTGDIIEFGFELVSLGQSSVTVRCNSSLILMVNRLSILLDFSDTLLIIID